MKRRATIAAFTLSCFTVMAFWALPAGQASGLKSANAMTFSKNVAPIFFKNCAECHRPGEAAPFSVLTYKDARPWAKSIREKVVSREMPPWHADPHFSEFKNDRRLTQSEIDTIVAWVDGGAQEGAAKDLPPPPKFSEGWNIGKPDAVFQMVDEYSLAANGPDEYVNFYIPTNFTEDKYVQMAEARPGNRRIVHHILVAVVPPNKQGAASGKSGVSSLNRTKPDAPVHDDTCSTPAQSFEEEQWLAQFAPGLNPDIFEPGIAKKIPAGATLRMQVHYSKTSGSAQQDRSLVGLVFAKEPPKLLIRKGVVGNATFKIPPGAERHRVAACWTTNRDIQIYSYLPHMHLRGAAMEYKASYPDGKTEVLMSVPKYSFSWQTSYVLKTPKLIPKGTRIMVTAYYDNSARNKFNPDPAQAVRHGEPTYDEMMFGLFDFIPGLPPPMKIDPQTLAAYAGKYQLAPNVVITITREGDRLYVIAPPGEQRVELFAESETKFVAPEFDGHIAFIRNEKGEVTELTAEINGRPYRARKI